MAIPTVAPVESFDFDSLVVAPPELPADSLLLEPDPDSPSELSVAVAVAVDFTSVVIVVTPPSFNVLVTVLVALVATRFVFTPVVNAPPPT